MSTVNPDVLQGGEDPYERIRDHIFAGVEPAASPSEEAVRLGFALTLARWCKDIMTGDEQTVESTVSVATMWLHNRQDTLYPYISDSVRHYLGVALAEAGYYRHSAGIIAGMEDLSRAADVVAHAPGENGDVELFMVMADLVALQGDERSAQLQEGMQTYLRVLEQGASGEATN